jgi:ketosteroid isomerase-like protein
MSDALMKISMLVTRLGMAFDDQDYDRLSDCWAPEATLTFTNAAGLTRETQGRDEIMRSVSSAWASGAITIRHFVSSVDIDLNGDEALVRYYTLYPIIGPEPRKAGFGEYRTKVAKQADGNWRVVHQTLHQHSMGEGDYAR